MKIPLLNHFQQSIFTLFKGNVIAQIISVTGAIILAKLFGAENYGVYAVYLSISAIIAIVSTLQLDLGIVITKKDAASKNLANSLFIVVVTVCLLFFLLIQFIFNDYPFGMDNSIILLSIAAGFLLANNKIFESILTRNKKFNLIARGKIILSMATVSLQALLYLYYPKTGLIIGSLLATLVLLLYYLLVNLNQLKLPSIKLFRQNLIKNKNLLLFALPSNLVNALAIHLLPILILTYFSSAESGSYSLSLKLLTTPLFLISTSISQVYFQKASELVHQSNHELYSLTKSVVKTNLVLFLIILILINTLGIYLLNLYFGSDWENLQSFTLILSIS